jgi:SAM-dependent methyltransferase
MVRTDRDAAPLDAQAPWWQLADWFGTGLGKRFMRAEVDALGRVVPDLFGFHMVQVGRAPGLELADLCRARRFHVVDLTTGAPSDSLCLAVPEYLPLRSDSVDAVVLPHVLEFCSDPYQALREVDRVLVPEGHVLLSGFNPWSAWGARMLLHRKIVPWAARMLPVGRLRDWLGLLGFDTVRAEFFCYSLPITRQGVFRHMQKLGTPGRRPWPTLCAGHVVLARKRVSTLIPLRPRWLPKRRLAPAGIAEPTPRSCHGQ